MGLGHQLGTIDMSENDDMGCDDCRKASLQGMSKPLLQIAFEKEGPIFLYRCNTCGCLWVETLRVAYPVSFSEAKAKFKTNEW